MLGRGEHRFDHREGRCDAVLATNQLTQLGGTRSAFHCTEQRQFEGFRADAYRESRVSRWLRIFSVSG